MRCAYCDTSNGPFHRDHVVPRSRGGPDEPINIVIACEFCNSQKRDRLPSEWLQHVPHDVAMIEQRVSAIVAREARGGRRGVIVTRKPPRVACDACGRPAFPSFQNMHVCWWYDFAEGATGSEPAAILAFEVLCTGHARCLARKEEAMELKFGRRARLNDLPVASYFGRWAWVELESLFKRYDWSPSDARRIVAVMRQLSKMQPDEEPSSECGEEDDPETIDD